jgi:hypothetical protein
MLRPLCCLAGLLFSLALRLTAAEPTDPLVAAGLQACTANGVAAAVRAWYAGEPEVGAAVETRLVNATRDLGPPLGTEIVSVQRVSQRVQRYFIAVYFRQRPLWLRLDRYHNGERVFLMPLKFSFDPDDILPAYVTEFRL